MAENNKVLAEAQSPQRKKRGTDLSRAFP